MKKFMLLVMVSLCVMVSVEPVFAAYDWRYLDYNKAKRAKAEAFFRKCDVLVKEIETLATGIVKNNKPAFEAKLTKQERDISSYGAQVVWNRVWAKDKTLVFGLAAKNKIFYAIHLATSDPNFVFSGGIRVGASTKVLESFFSDTISNIGTIKGKTVIINGPHWEGPESVPIIQITCKNGIVTEILFN